MAQIVKQSQTDIFALDTIVRANATEKDFLDLVERAKKRGLLSSAKPLCRVWVAKDDNGNRYFRTRNGYRFVFWENEAVRPVAE